MTDNTFEIVVTGESMWPVLVPGQRYGVRRDTEPQLGDIVVAQHPADLNQTIVKRLSNVQVMGDEEWVMGKTRNPSSHHSLPITHYTLTGTVSWSSSFTVTRDQILGVIDQPTTR